MREFIVHLNTLVRATERGLSRFLPAKVSRGHPSPGSKISHHSIWKIVVGEEAP